MAAAVVIVWPLSNKFGKKNVTVVGMIVGVIGGIISIVGGENVVPVAIGVALKCLGSAPACYMILAMISDVLDH
jgi:GPH family glycoside/pentoside/hexuronide:cation symporter